MPTIRYQMRNEYGLADTGLYQTAGKDDPEAILEGVAMAGLVGMLRQLGDLAEFAAEIFCDLHEDVMGMAARGHGLVLRVQQIEAELPTVDESLLSHSHPNFAYNDGIDWHSNIQMEQNLITQGDMPRFILDSYEECHGPPRLFTLDKFDIAGAGACLKRYSDPSFFKMAQASSSLMETNIPIGIKIQKIKKGSRWSNGQTLESLLSTLADPNLQQTNSDEVLDEGTKHFVRLKSSNFNGANGSGDNLRKSFLALHSDEHKVVFDHSSTHSNFNAISMNSSEFSSNTHGTVLDISANHSLPRNGSHNMIPSKVVATLRTDQMDNWKERDEKLSDEQLESIYVVENQKRNFNFVERKEKFIDFENKQEGSAYDYELTDPTGTISVQVVDHHVIEDELKLDGSSTDGYRTEDIGSELESSIDVLNSMESEVETDPENNVEPYLNMLREEAHEMNGDDSNEVLEKLQNETPELYSAEDSTRAVGLGNILESGMPSILYCDTVIEPTVMLATQGNKGVLDSYGNSNLIRGRTYNEKYEELLPHDKVTNSADLISDGASNLRTFEMRFHNTEESCSPNVISSSLNNLQPQESFHTHLLVSSNQNEISVGHIAQLRTDKIARCFNGSSHSDSNFPAERIIAEHVNEMVLEVMTGTHQMLNDHSFSTTESFSMDPEKERLLIMAVPAGKEKQNSVDQDSKSFASEDVKASSTGRDSSTLIIASAPVNSMDVAQFDELAAEMDHVRHPEELTSKTSAKFAKKTNHVDQNMNDSTLGTKDSNVSGSSHIASNAVVLMSEEESFIRQLVDRLSDTEHKNSLVTDLPCIEVPEYPSNAPTEKFVWSVSQDFGENSTETMLLPVPSFATISGKDCTKKIENTGSVDKLSMVGSVLGFDNSCTEIDAFATPNILQPHLQLISDTEESQESLKTNLADQSYEFLNLKITVESKESSKLNIAEDSQKSFKVITAERMSSSCSRSEICTNKISKSPMHVHDSLKFSIETNQDDLEKNGEVVDQIVHIKNLSTEYSSPYDDPSLVYCQDAYDLQSVVNSTETLLPPAPSVVAAGDKDCVMEIENIDEVESLFSLESADEFENVQMTKADRETPKILQPMSEYFSDTQESQESFKVNSEEESQESTRLSSTEESYEFPNFNPSEESQESSEVQASEWVTSPCSGSGTCSDRVTSSTMLVLDYLKFSTDINHNPQKNIENVNRIIHAKNLSPENSASGSETYNHNPSLGYNQEANSLQSKLKEDSTDFSAAPCEVVVLIHERDCSNNLEVLDARTYLDMSVSSELDKSPLVSDASCSGLLGEINDDIPIVHVEAYAHTSVTETANQELSLPTNMFVDTARSPKDASTLYSIIPESSHQKAEDLELGIPTNSDNIDKLSEGPKLNYHDITNNIKYNEVDMLQSDERQGMEVHALSKRSSEISSFHLTSNVLDATVSHFPKSDVPLTESATGPSSEPLLDEPASNFASQNPEESTPLPPLPPLEWTTRKIQLSSQLPSEDSSESLAGTNPFTEPLYEKPAKPNVAPPFTSYEVLPTIVDQRHQHDPVFLEGRVVNSSNAPLLFSSSLEYEKRGSKSHVVDSFTPVVLENQITEDSTSQESVGPMLDKSFHFSQPDPGLELEESHYSERTQQKFEKGFVRPQNPYFIGYSFEDVSNQSIYRDFGGEKHFLKPTELSISSRPMPQPDCVFSLNKSQTNLLGVVPPTEDEWFSIRPRSIRNLPRNPLMEAVAAHDRSTLRKVSESARSSEPKADKNGTMLMSNMLQLRKVSEILKPSIEPKAVEKDAWIQQIRSKSFSLKPAILVKPYINGHPTNIKVAAILEKANALRQAVAVSDEEDGADSWSDC